MEKQIYFISQDIYFDSACQVPKQISYLVMQKATC